MPQDRFYCDAHFSEGVEVYLEGQELHHLAHVMRVKVDEEVELVNGRGQLANGLICDISKKRADIKLLSVYESSKAISKLALYQAFPKANRLETLLEKCTELGVTKFCLFPGERSEKFVPSDNKIQRMRTTCIAAMKQCGRLDLPEIVILPRVKDWELDLSGVCYGDVREDAPSILSFGESSEEEKGFIVGPESGLSEAEVLKLEELGAKGVSLHGNILRTDTAAIVGVAFLSSR